MSEDLVRVAVAKNGPEGEMIEGLLADAGIPVLLVRSKGFDVPDFLAAGPRDVMVPADAQAKAREILGTQAHD